MKNLNIKIHWSNEFFLIPKEKSVIILVDTLRASSVIPSALFFGAHEVITVHDIDLAFHIKQKNPNALLAGERSGIIIDGFDCGNSPVEMEASARDKTVVLNTGNFCSVINSVSEKCVNVLAASMVNAQATAEYIYKNNFQNIYIIATGTYHMHGQKYDEPIKSMEDLIAGLFVIYELSKMINISDEVFGEHQKILKDEKELINFLWNTEYAQYLLELDKKQKNNRNREDMEFCFSVNKFPCVSLLHIENNFLKFKKI